MSSLFAPFALRSLELHNRIVVSPMCQYSAVDGSASAWHRIHLGTLSMSGAALLFVEATAVSRDGRITPGCLGLYSDDNEAALAAVLADVRKYATAKIGIQLGHAGRKASCALPWDGGALIGAGPGGWERVAPSPLAFLTAEPPPTALDDAGLARIKQAFVDATQRAARLGFDVVELHCAHGYLMHEFLSPLSNVRTDAYGSDRMSFPLEVFAAMRAAWPQERPMGVRVSATDWVEGGWTIDDTVVFARRLRALGCDFVDCSSGGSSPTAKIAVGPGFQVPFARQVKKEAGIATIAVGMITEPRQAQQIVEDDGVDLVAMARAFLWDPRWAWHAAVELGAKVRVPPQLLRATPSGITNVLTRG